MSSSLSTPSLSAAALLAALALCFTPPSQAQDELFEEDFEDRKFCRWSASTGGETDCVSCVGRPDGTQCADPLITSCGGCDYPSLCAEFAERDCPCLTYSCSAGACVATSGMCSQPCGRDTEGAYCPQTGCGPGQFIPHCCNNGQCVACGECGDLVGAAVAALRFEPARCEEPAASDPLFATSTRFAGFR